MNHAVNEWLKVLLVALVVLTVSEVFGQGCSQCKQDVKHSSIDNDAIGITENADAKRTLFLYYIGIPLAVVTTVLIVVLRKKIASVFRK